MTGEADVINEGHILVKDGMIEAVWEDEVPSDIQLEMYPFLKPTGPSTPGCLTCTITFTTTRHRSGT